MLNHCFSSLTGRPVSLETMFKPLSELLSVPPSPHLMVLMVFGQPTQKSQKEANYFM